MAVQHEAKQGSTRNSLPGSGGRHRARNRHSGACVWLGTGVLTLGVGVALTGASGIAQADTTSSTVNGPSNPGGKSIRTVLSAQTVTSSSPEDGGSGGATSNSIVSVKDSVVSSVNPANPGSNDNNNPSGSSLTSQLLGLNGDSSGLGVALPDLGTNAPSVPFFDFGGGGLASKIAHALSGGRF